MNIRKRLLSIVLSLGALGSWSTAGATTCPNATAITGTLPIINQALACDTGNDITSSNTVASCGVADYYGGKEALYTYTPAANQTVTISYNGGTTTNYVGIFVFSGCPTTAGTTCVGAGNTSSGYTGSVTVTLSAGTTYYLMFDTWPSPASPCPGTFSITTCQKPVTFLSGNVGSSTASLNFTGTAPNYQLEWGTSGVLGSATNTRTTATTSPLAITGLTQGANHSAWIRSICAAGDTSIWSAPITFTTSVACAMPTAVNLSSITLTGVSFVWTAPATAPASGYGYEVRSSGAAGSGATGLAASGTTVAGVTTASVTGLSSSTGYTVYVRANCGVAGYSNWTAGKSFTTLCVPLSTFPFTDTFVATGLPACWSAASNGTGSANNWTGKTSDGLHGVAGSSASSSFVAFNVYNAVTANNPYTLTSRPYTLSSPAKQLEYDYYLGDDGYKGTTGVGGTDPYPMMVLGTKDAGITWDTLYRHSYLNSTFAGNSAVSNWTQNTLILPVSYAGQEVQFRFVSRSNYGYNFCNQALDEVTVTNAPACQVPLSVALTNVLSSTATASWSAPVAVPAAGYQYEVRSSGAAGSGATGLVASGTTAAGITTVALTGLSNLTAYTFYVRSNCGSSTYSVWSAGKSLFTLCVGPTLTASTGATRCAGGNVTLTATGTGSTIFWYADSTVNGPFYKGASLTNYVSSTGNFYVAAVDTAHYTGLGNTTIPTTAGDSIGRGIVVRATQSFRINTVDIYSTVTSGVIIGGAALVDSATGNTVASYPIGFNAGNTPQWYTVPLYQSAWYLTAGRTYYLTARFTSGSARRHTTGVDYSSATYNNLGAVGVITSGYENGATTTSYNYFHNFNVTAICASPRVAVPVTINTPPAVTLRATPSPVCAGNSATITATSVNAGYTYTWNYLPGSSTGASVTINPTTSGNYRVYAFDSSLTGPYAGCYTSDSIFLAVNPLPAVPVVSPAVLTGLCLGDTVRLSAFTASQNSYLPTPLYAEDFNGATVTMANVNINTTANAAKGAWLIKGAGYSYKGVSFSSPTNTSFAMSNSDSASNGPVNAALVSPAINAGNAAGLALAFKHYLRLRFWNDSAVVEVSTNSGTSWTAVKAYFYSAPGTAGSFSADTISLNSYAGQANLKFRFRHGSDTGYYWALDDVKLLALSPLPVSWTSNPVASGGLPATAGVSSVGNAAIGAVPTAPGNYVYTAVLTNAAGCTRTVNTAPVIVGNLPTAGTIAVTGQSPTFTFTASGNLNDSLRGWFFGDGGYDTTGRPLVTTHTYAFNGTYVVKFYVVSGCGIDSVSTTVVVTNSAGINDLNLDGQVTLFPNPAANYFVVQNSSAQKMKSITVLNVLGAVVQQLKTDNGKEQHIAIDGLAAGSYLVRITLDGTTVIRRLQITK